MAAAGFIEQVIVPIDLPAGTPAVYPFFTPVRAGDTLDAFVFSLASEGGHGVNNGLAIQVEAYACNRRPATVAEARLGQPVITGPLWIQMVPYLTDTAAGEGIFILKESFPLDFIPDQHQRFLALVLETGGASIGNVRGAVFAKIFRARER